MTKKVLCLDWDKRSLRIVVARVGGGSMKLEDGHALRIPAGTNSDDPAAMGAFIAQSLQRLRLSFKRVVLDVPRDKAVINRLRLPPTPATELAAAVRFQALRELPFPLDDAEIDYVVMQRDSNRNVCEVLLAAVRREALTQLRETCKAAGLTPARIGLRPFANLISVRRLPEMLERRVLLLDVGPSTTEIDVFRAQSLVFSRSASVSVPLQGGEIVGDDSRVSSKAELTGIELASSAEEQAVDELLVEITRTLQAYRAAEADAAIDQIIVAGGTGIEYSLLTAVDERFGLPATLFDPTTALGVPSHEATKLRAFSAALGLAWGLSEEGLLEIDFLNPKKPIPRKETLRRKARLAGVAAGVLAASAISAVAYDRISLNRQAQRLRKEIEPKLAEATKILDVEIKALEARDWTTQANMHVWLDHLLELTRLAGEGGDRIQPGKNMLVQSMSFDARNALINMKLACDDWETGNEFAKLINQYEVDGKHPYRAKQGKWSETKSGEAKFKGSVPLDVELLELQKFVAGEKAREAARKAMSKDL